MEDNTIVMPVSEEIVDAKPVTSDAEQWEIDGEAFRLLNLKSQMDYINSAMSDMTNAQVKSLKDGENFGIIDKIVNDHTVDELKALTHDDIDNIMVDEDGDKIEFSIDFETEAKRYEFIRDYLVLHKESQAASDEMTKELAKINEEISKSQEEFDKLSEAYGNPSEYIRAKLVECLEKSDSDDKKEIYTRLLTAFDNALTLDNVKSYCKSYRGRYIIGDYRNEKKSEAIFRKYLKVIETMKITTKLNSFVNLEKRFLSEKYQSRDNIFMFAIIHYIASWHNKDIPRADGLFLTQFGVNIKNLCHNKFPNDEDKATFISNMEEVIDIIG